MFLLCSINSSNASRKPSPTISAFATRSTRRSPSSSPRSRASASLLCRSPSSSRGSFQQAAQGDRDRNRGGPRHNPGCRRARSGGQRLHQRPARSRRLRRRRCSARSNRTSATRPAGKDHRRAHQHQSQQGRPYRASAQCRAGRYFRAHAARARPPRRGAELHRQHRRAGGRRRGRVSLSRKENARRCRGADRRRATVSTTSAGISTRGRRSITRTNPKRSRGAPRPCTPSKPARANWPRLAHLVADAIVQRASGDHAAARHRVRRAAARERDPASAVLGGGVRAAETAQGHLSRNAKARTPAAG